MVSHKFSIYAGSATSPELWKLPGTR